MLSVVTCLKGKLTLGLVSVFVPLVGIVSALRLARPGSIWAQLFYTRDRKRSAPRRASILTSRSSNGCGSASSTWSRAGRYRQAPWPRSLRARSRRCSSRSGAIRRPPSSRPPRTPARHLRPRPARVLGRGGAARVTWFEPFDTVCEWELPYAKWFLGGKLNITYNCVDRHVEAGNGDRVAYYWEGEPVDDRREVTFADLQRETTKLANALKSLGVGKGTPVGIYMGMVPETAVAMLACARIGAPHTVVFGGFSADSLADRLNDMGCEVLITQDEAWRRGCTVAAEEDRRRGDGRRAGRRAAASSCAGPAATCR